MALCGSYAPLSIDAARAVSADRPAYYVLMELTSHATPTGMCWPGVQRLSALTHYSTGTVQAALGRLMTLDYIRFHVTVDPIRRKSLVTFQVSPYVMYIREELEKEALENWNQAKRGGVMSSLTKNIEPEPEPASANQNPNQLERTNSGLPEGDDAKTPQFAPKTGNTDEYSAIAPHSATAPATAPNGATSAYALNTDIPAAADGLAAWLAANFRTRHEQAVALVAAHGVAKVIAGIDAVRARPNVRKPFGLLKSLLEPSEPSPMEKAIRSKKR